MQLLGEVPGVTPYNGLYGEAPPERETFFRLQVYKRVRISQVEVYKRVGKSLTTIYFLSKRRNDIELYWDIVLVLEERIGYLRQMGRHIPVLLITERCDYLTLFNLSIN